jgi:16S rRNA (cytosine967-C5)-methyltransferase
VGLILDEPGPLEKLAPFQQGLIQVQDEAAQAVGFWARPAGHQRLLDACAAPGGKTCHVLERMEPGATMLALDVHAHKLGRITGEAKRLGVDGPLTVLAHDAATPLPGTPQFDGVLVDAPCTGLGTLRRHPELRYRRQPEDIARLAVLQAQILAQTARAVAPGGMLTYAICSVTDEEGVQQVDQFLAAHPGFERVPAADLPTSLAPLTTPVGDLQTWPDLHDLDGFYAATVRRSK